MRSSVGFRGGSHFVVAFGGPDAAVSPTTVSHELAGIRRALDRLVEIRAVGGFTHAQAVMYDALCRRESLLVGCAT